MPFTPTHVLAVVPIAAVKRWRLPFSALAIGSMVPDIPLFVPMRLDYLSTHSTQGLITACLPLGLVGFLVWQLLMKRPLFALLPEAVQRRCVPFSHSCIEPNAWFLGRVTVAVVIGAMTHVVWDSFTHQGRFGANHVPGLNGTAFVLAGRAVPGTKMLQYGCTVLGLPGLMALLAAWLRRRAPEPLDGSLTISPSVKALVLLVLIAIPGAVAVLVATQGLLRGDSTLHRQLGRVVTTSGLALFLVTLAYCLTYPITGLWLHTEEPVS